MWTGRGEGRVGVWTEGRVGVWTEGRVGVWTGRGERRVGMWTGGGVGRMMFVITFGAATVNSILLHRFPTSSDSRVTDISLIVNASSLGQ